MASDQKRWFKVWTSLLVDMDHLPHDAIGRWVRLGCRIALVGTDGTCRFEGWDHLARFLGVPADVPPDDVRGAVDRLVDNLPNIHVYEDDTRNDTQNDKVHGGRYGTFPVTVCVTMDNWRKYQEDSTVAARMKKLRALRAKKRREEMRGEVPPKPPRPSSLLRAKPEPETAPERTAPKSRETIKAELLAADSAPAPPPPTAPPAGPLAGELQRLMDSIGRKVAERAEEAPN
jgi:hypothetical protein